MVAEVKRAENIARQAVSAASIDDIRKGGAAQVFNAHLAGELMEARAATAAAKGEVSSMQDEKKNIFEQQMANEMERPNLTEPASCGRNRMS